jgi:autotransporter passenger strand-loop-strand repeat protein
VSAGGTELISAGGTEIGGTVGSGGSQNVGSGGVASGGTVSGGTETVGSGGQTLGPVVVSGGSEVITSGGTGSGSKVSAGGTETVSSGGTEIGATIGSGGTGIVASGGTEAGATVSSGGTLIFASGGTATTPIMVSSGGTIELPGVGSGSAMIVTSGGTQYLQVTSGGSVVESIPVTGGPGMIVTSGGNTYFEACFGRGTKLATPTGETAVEDLSVGDTLVTLDGPKPIKWIGYRSVHLSPSDFESLRTAGRRSAGGETRQASDLAEQMPIRVLRGAVAENVPHRDLLISPEHALYLDGVMVPVRHLVNGTTISHVTDLQSFQYFHIEMERHSVLFAEGVTTESWLDTGNRDAFENAEAVVVPHPAFATKAADHAWANDACAELVTSGEKLVAIRRTLIDRALAMGAMTNDPQVRVLADGAELAPVSCEDGRYVFEVPSAPTGLTILSRSARGCEIAGDPADRRRLGVALFGITLRSGAKTRRIGLDNPALVEGFSYCEGSAEMPYRWTDGRAVIPATLLRGFAANFELVLDVSSVAYSAQPTTAEAALPGEWDSTQQAG